MKTKILVVILCLFSIPFFNCLSKPKLLLKPCLNTNSKVNIDFKIEQKLFIVEEGLSSLCEASLRLDVLESTSEKLKLSGKFDKYDVSSKIGKTQKIPQFETINNLKMEFEINNSGNVSISNMDFDDTGLTKQDIEISLEQLLSLMLNGFPEEAVEEKSIWHSEFEIPFTIQEESNLIKKYILNYKFEKLHDSGEIGDLVHIIVNGNINIIGDNIIDSKGSINNAYILFDLKNKFVKKLNLTEDFEFEFNNENLSKIAVKQSIIAETSFE